MAPDVVSRVASITDSSETDEPDEQEETGLSGCPVATVRRPHRGDRARRVWRYLFADRVVRPCTSRHDATFEISSKTNAHAIRRLLERTYDVVREAVARSDPEGTSSDETLRAFEAVCEAMDTPAPGTLTVVYERHSEGFD